MSAFAAGINAIFADPNMAKVALYRAGGAGTGVPVRVIFRAPDRLVNWNEGRFVTDTHFLDVRVSEVQTLATGDTFVLGVPAEGEVAYSMDLVADSYSAVDVETFEVRSEPLRDRERLCWAAEVREL